VAIVLSSRSFKRQLAFTSSRRAFSLYPWFDIGLIMIYCGIMQANFKPPFRQFVKKAHQPLQLAIEDVVEDICAAPDLGEAKVGDLAGVLVYKFRFNRQEYLVAYRSPPKALRERGDTTVEFLSIDFYQVGPHEKFYEKLKRYLKEG